MTKTNTTIVTCQHEGCKAKLPASYVQRFGTHCPMHKEQAPKKPFVKAEYVVCVTETCHAKLPVALAEKHEGKCPRCAGVNPTPTKVKKGGACCTACSAVIPVSKVEEWGGKCPKCNGNEQTAFVRTPQQSTPDNPIVPNRKVVVEIPTVEELMALTKDAMIARCLDVIKQGTGKEVALSDDAKAKWMKLKKQALADKVLAVMTKRLG